MTRLQQAGTGEVWLYVQRELRRGARHRARLGASLGADEDVWDLVNSAMSGAVQALELAQRGFGDPTAVLTAAYAQLQRAYHIAVVEGLGAVGEGIAVLAARVAEAIRTIGRSWADVLEALLGAKPAELLLGAAVIAALGLVGATVVLSGAGGQQALVTLAQRRVVL